MRDTHKRWATGWFGARSKDEMDALSRKVYEDHYALVRKVTPKERLLEYKFGQGWEPLCEFLGKEVPDVPFPRVNDSNALWELLVVIAWRGMRNIAIRFLQLGGPLLLALLAGWWYWYRS